MLRCSQKIRFCNAGLRILNMLLVDSRIEGKSMESSSCGSQTGLSNCLVPGKPKSAPAIRMLHKFQILNALFCFKNTNKNNAKTFERLFFRLNIVLNIALN
jgi:hypothetical protein